MRDPSELDEEYQEAEALLLRAGAEWKEAQGAYVALRMERRLRAFRSQSLLPPPSEEEIRAEQASLAAWRHLQRTSEQADRLRSLRRKQRRRAKAEEHDLGARD